MMHQSTTIDNIVPQRTAKAIDLVTNFPGDINWWKREDRMVFCLVNGKRSIKDLSSILQKSEDDIAINLLNLTEKEMVKSV